MMTVNENTHVACWSAILLHSAKALCTLFFTDFRPRQMRDVPAMLKHACSAKTSAPIFGAVVLWFQLLPGYTGM